MLFYQSWKTFWRTSRSSYFYIMFFLQLSDITFHKFSCLKFLINILVVNSSWKVSGFEFIYLEFYFRNFFFLHVVIWILIGCFLYNEFDKLEKLIKLIWTNKNVSNFAVCIMKFISTNSVKLIWPCSGGSGKFCFIWWRILFVRYYYISGITVRFTWLSIFLAK